MTSQYFELFPYLYRALDEIVLLFNLSLIAWTILGIQIVYLVVFLIAFMRKKESGPGEAPPVSIIVCAHDEEQNLRELIPLLLQQDYPQIEIIVVEDRCNDGTYDFLLEETKLDQRLKMVRVRHLPEHINGKKYALTLGIKAATFEWVLLTDADCRPEGTQWVKTMASHFSNEKEIVIGHSPFVKSGGYLNSFIRFESLLTSIQFIGSALLGRPYMGVGRNLAYRKKLFIDNKGFNNYLSLAGGDDDLFVNQHASNTNTAVNISQGSLVWSLPKRTWREFGVQKLRHLSAGKKYRISDKLILGLFSITWILNWVFVVPVMMVLSPMQSYVWVGFIVREIILIVLIYRASKTLGDPFEGWKTPVLDFNYAIYYLGTGLMAWVSKRVRWKI